MFHPPSKENKKGIYPYVTVEELRRKPDLLEVQTSDAGGTRFVGPTEIPVALRYFAKKDGAVLECGPVFGKFLKVLQDEGYTHVHGLDFVDMLTFPDRARLTFHAIDFNMEKFPYPDNFFDGIAAWGFGEHLENPYHFMREAHRTLKPGEIFIFSLPSVFHIMGRVLFLKNGMFPKWNQLNNHIALFPRGVFDKTFLRYFSLVEIIYTKPWIKAPPYALFRAISRWLPSNEWFANYVVYVLKKKEFVPYA